ncbi:hypothetical protein FB451DRAFT_1403430 [Mycena latifolia]|nr:hypothetical protein FB451DRAFT_1403430 [Mycena latifolia]
MAFPLDTECKESLAAASRRFRIFGSVKRLIKIDDDTDTIAKARKPVLRAPLRRSEDEYAVARAPDDTAVARMVHDLHILRSSLPLRRVIGLSSLPAPSPFPPLCIPPATRKLCSRRLDAGVGREERFSRSSPGRKYPAEEARSGDGDEVAPARDALRPSVHLVSRSYEKTCGNPARSGDGFPARDDAVVLRVVSLDVPQACTTTLGIWTFADEGPLLLFTTLPRADAVVVRCVWTLPPRDSRLSASPPALCISTSTHVVRPVARSSPSSSACLGIRSCTFGDEGRPLPARDDAFVARGVPLDVPRDSIARPIWAFRRPASVVHRISTSQAVFPPFPFPREGHLTLCNTLPLVITLSRDSTRPRRFLGSRRGHSFTPAVVSALYLRRWTPAGTVTLPTLATDPDLPAHGTCADGNVPRIRPRPAPEQEEGLLVSMDILQAASPTPPPVLPVVSLPCSHACFLTVISRHPATLQCWRLESPALSA